MPLTVGPGAISVAIARPKEAVDFAHLAVLAGVAIAGLAAVAGTIYISYRFAEPTIAALGNHGTNVVVRLSASLLLCIGTQIAWTGLSELQAPRFRHIEPPADDPFFGMHPREDPLQSAAAWR
jgi:multiple antibiotic resistance protein